MIIDCHGHYTTAPTQLGDYRDAQKAALEADPNHVGEKGRIDISDDELRESIEGNQLRLQRERNIDLTIFSPRASWMGHHIGNEHTSRFWSEHCNELIRRICDLYPDNFAPGLPAAAVARRQRRVVGRASCGAASRRWASSGATSTRIPSGGNWTGPPLFDPYWRPLFDAMCELDVPAMIHVSATCNPNFHSTSSHYLGADTTAFVQALTSGLFRRLPDDAVGHSRTAGERCRTTGAASRAWPRSNAAGRTLDELMDNIFFDTCVYHQPGIDLLVDVVPTDNILFASEMVGAVKGSDPDTGEFYDDTKLLHRPRRPHR